MMKTIIISDIHNRVFWIEEFLNKTPHDKVIFLGDYFDNFFDTDADAEETAKWLKQSLKFSNRIHLMGNHDVPYRYIYHSQAYCPGFTKSKNAVINSILSKDDWNKLPFIAWEQNWLLSHAGFNPTYLKVNPTHVSIKETIDSCIKRMESNLNNGLEDELLNYGTRMGELCDGGITWQHWGDFIPIENVNQIVGHTHTNIPLFCYLRNDKNKTLMKSINDKYIPKMENIISKNYNIDTENEWVGILEDGKLTLFNRHIGDVYHDNLDDVLNNQTNPNLSLNRIPL